MILAALSGKTTSVVCVKFRIASKAFSLSISKLFDSQCLDFGKRGRSMKMPSTVCVWAIVFVAQCFHSVISIAQNQVVPLAGIDFKSAPASAFYSELTIRATGTGVSYTACGFDHGWLGVQELVGRKKTVVFSVVANSKSKPAKPLLGNRQVRVVETGKGVRELPRSGQGKVELSFDLDWEIGDPLRFILYAKSDNAKSDNAKTLYSAYCYLIKENRWQHVGTCSLDSGGRLLSGLHSCIGGVSIDGVDDQKRRSCDVESPWLLVQGKWQPAVSAKTSSNQKSAKNAVAGVRRGHFFLRTEADSETKRLDEDLELRLPKAERKPPFDLPIAMGDGEMGRRRFRILAYNIKHGRGNDNQVDLHRTAEVIRRLHPDFVALQEVDYKVQRSGGIDQARELSLLTGLQHHAFGSFFDYQGGQYGMAVLSRNPIVGVKNLRLPDGAEPRTSLVVDVKLGLKKQLQIADVHFYRTEQERLNQARRLLDFLEEGEHDIAIVGDFNSKPESSIIELFQSQWEIPDKGADHFTFRSDHPEVEIDYALLHKDSRWSVSEIDVIEEPVVSDHRPLVLEIIEER